MKARNRLAALGVAASCLAAPTVPAQPAGTLCGPRDGMVAMLADRFGEQPRAAGIVDGGKAVTELLVNEETGSWSLLMSDLTGRSCLLTGGGDWIGAARPKPVGNSLPAQPGKGGL